MFGGTNSVGDRQEGRGSGTLYLNHIKTLIYRIKRTKFSPAFPGRLGVSPKCVIFGRGFPSAAVWSIPHRGYCSSFLINYFRQNACVRAVTPRALLACRALPVRCPACSPCAAALKLMATGVWATLEFVGAANIVRCSTSHLRALTTQPFPCGANRAMITSHSRQISRPKCRSRPRK